MKKKKLLVPILAVAIMVTCSMTAHGRGFGHGHDKHGVWDRFSGMRFLLALNLTQAQQGKILEIMDKYREENNGLRQRMRKARSEIRDVIASEKLDEAALRNALRKTSSVREDIFVQRARMRAEIKKVLTPDQLRLLESRKDRLHKECGRYDGKKAIKGR